MTSHYSTKFAAYLVHLFTASGAIVGLLAVSAIYSEHYIHAFWLMGLAVFIDAIDGTFARLLNVKRQLPQIDGVLLDNIVDYFNYVIVPACLLLMSALMPHGFQLLGAGLVLLSSAYQFCQADAKTSDHFFKGFPSYWNIVVIYLYFWQMPPSINLGIICALAVLVFVPIKYVYPSRLDYLTNNKYLRVGMLLATLVWGAAILGLLWIYPKSNLFLTMLSSGYLALYLIVSIYRTFVSLPDGQTKELKELAEI